MKPVDTHLSELEHWRLHLSGAEQEARKRNLLENEVGNLCRALYWAGYADHAQDAIEDIDLRIQWHKDHPL